MRRIPTSLPWKLQAANTRRMGCLESHGMAWRQTRLNNSCVVPWAHDDGCTQQMKSGCVLKKIDPKDSNHPLKHQPETHVCSTPPASPRPSLQGCWGQAEQTEMQGRLCCSKGVFPWKAFLLWMWKLGFPWFWWIVFSKKALVAIRYLWTLTCFWCFIHTNGFMYMCYNSCYKLLGLGCLKFSLRTACPGFSRAAWEIMTLLCLTGKVQ